MVDEKEYQMFIEYLHKGVMLLENKEFDDFHFDINKDDSKFRELASLLVSEGINDQTYFKNIEPKASEILKKLFTSQKVKDVCKILEAIEGKNSDDKEICTITAASRLFLEDAQAEHFHLPLAITRLVEDVYMTFTEAPEGAAGN